MIFNMLKHSMYHSWVGTHTSWVLLSLTLLQLARSSTTTTTNPSCKFSTLGPTAYSAFEHRGLNIPECLTQCCREGCSFIDVFTSSCSLYWDLQVPSQPRGSAMHRRFHPDCPADHVIAYGRCLKTQKVPNTLPGGPSKAICSAIGDRLAVLSNVPKSRFMKWMADEGCLRTWVGAKLSVTSTLFYWEDSTVLSSNSPQWGQTQPSTASCDEFVMINRQWYMGLSDQCSYDLGDYVLCERALP